MENATDYPFHCLFSLKPLIENLKKTLAASSSASEVGLLKDLFAAIEEVPELAEPIEDLSLLKRHDDLVQRLMRWVFPTVFWDTEPVAAVIPYTARPVLVSPRFRELFLNKDGAFSARRNVDEDGFNKGRAIRAYLLILEAFYSVHHNFDPPLIFTVPDSETGLDRYYKVRFDFRFVEVKTVNGPKALSKKERTLVQQHLTEPDVLREILPPEMFELFGFTVLQAVDVTELEVLVALERDLIDQESMISRDGFLRLQERLRALFHRPDLIAGLAVIQEDQVFLLNTGCEMTQCCIFADSQHIPISEFKGTAYEKAAQGEEVLLVHDILEEPFSEGMKKDFVQSGIRSLMIAPLCYKGECIGTLDIGSPRPGDLGPVDVMLMSHIQPLFSMAVKKALDDLDNRIQCVIKEKCTAVHPTVEWRFRKAAVRHLEDVRLGHASEMESIVFKEVFPFYGVSDIRGSTEERNRAISEDLSKHLTLALKIVSSANDAKPMLILRELVQRIQRQLDGIKAGLGTGDEVSIVKFLREEVEPVFSHLKRFDRTVEQAVEDYESAIDPNVGTVYGLRKEFEESISILNDRLTTYLDQEEAEIQAIFPHYFERHRTDGVDYLIYSGESLMEEGVFNDIYLKNLRLWQLRVACGMAVHTETLKPSLKVRLDTAHLVLIQNAPLSIRFRFDEKRFDVDGAYDIRQEIIKSRIDKAVVKGGQERLTQPGKIAIVYSHTDEAREMRQHIDFLRSEGYLTGEVEDLELAGLPGVEGLKSLRVGVDLESRVP